MCWSKALAETEVQRPRARVYHMYNEETQAWFMPKMICRIAEIPVTT